MGDLDNGYTLNHYVMNYINATTPIKSSIRKFHGQPMYMADLHVDDTYRTMRPERVSQLIAEFADKRLWDGEITSTPAKTSVTINTDLDRLGVIFNLLSIGDASFDLPAYLNDNIESFEQQCIEIEDQVSKDFIKGVNTVLQAMLRKQTLDQTLSAEIF